MSTLEDGPQEPDPCDDDALRKAEEKAREAHAEVVEAKKRLAASTEHFLEISWQAADALLAVDDGKLALFAVQRAYFAVMNCCVSSASLLDLPLERYQQGSQHHIERAAIPHSQAPVLASDLIALIYPGPGARGDEGRMKQTFETVRLLQKYRKRADYMGCEEVSAEHARDCIEWGKTLVTVIWEYTCEHYGD